MKTLPFQKIRSLGGKLGTEVEEKLQVQNAGDLWSFPLETLKAKLGEATGAWLYDICRGICHESVQQTSMAKSMGANKSLRPAISSMAELAKWVEGGWSPFFFYSGCCN
jgi:DNA polymerase eta